MSISIASLRNANPDCRTGVVLPHALAAGVEMVPTGLVEGMRLASGQHSKGAYLLDVGLSAGEKGKT